MQLLFGSGGHGEGYNQLVGWPSNLRNRGEGMYIFHKSRMLPDFSKAKTYMLILLVSLEVRHFQYQE